MASVVLLRGVNVGGHRTFRPSLLAEQLRHLGAVNVGAAGTFVIRKPITQAALRRELSTRLPFDADVAICQGREIAGLLSRHTFDRANRDVVPFVSVLCGPARLTPPLPMTFPPAGQWLVRILARENRFVIGQYRRHMKAIGHLGALDRLFGVPVTTRNWNTLTQIGSVLDRSV
jgi:uncharacterized protein (DUF1697 family)